MLNKKQSEEQTKDQHVRELESALEEVRSTFFIADLVFACSCLEEELRFGRADVNFLLSQIFVCRLKKEVGSTMSIFCGL